MAAVHFDITQAEELAKFLGLSIDKVAKRAVLAVGHRIVQRATSEVIPAEPRPPVDRRVYAAGWRARPTKEGAMVFNATPYASIIEYGARAENIKIGRAMIDALAAWVIRKGLVGRQGRGAAAKTQQQADARSMAWAIAMAMKKRGIFNGGKGLQILKKAMKGVERFFADEMKREIAREFKA